MPRGPDRGGLTAGSGSRNETVGTIALGGFVAVACAMPLLAPVDAWAGSLAHDLRDWLAFRSVIWLTRGAPYLAATLVALAAAVAHWRGVGRRPMLRVLAQFAVGLVLLEGLKLSCMRWRPGGLAVHPVPDSFPSGHVANAAVSVVAAIELVRCAFPARRLMQALSAYGAAFVVAVAGTRLYFELHWLTDIVASLLLGVAFASYVAAYRVTIPRRARIGVVAALLLLYLAPATGIRVWLGSPAAPAVTASLTNVAPRPCQVGDGCPPADDRDDDATGRRTTRPAPHVTTRGFRSVSPS